MATNGWIKIHRQILDKGWFTKSSAVHLWVYLLMKASFDDKEYMWNGENIKLKPGQFVTGRKQISKETGIHESSVERLLNFFEKSEQQIEQQKSSTSRLISIRNYTVWQSSEQQVNNKRTTAEQPLNTNKEVKELKERKNIGDKSPDQTLEVKQKKFIDELAPFVEKFGRDTVNAFYNYWREPNKSKTKMKFEQERTWDLNLRLIRWASNDFNKSKVVPLLPSGPSLAELHAQKIFNEVNTKTAN